MSQPSSRPTLYKGYRFPREIISRCVWLYYRFGVSLRDVSELMLARGIKVSHEAIRLWTLRFGTEYARRLRRTRGASSNIWHLDELCLMINRERGWLWRAVDNAGEVLDVLVQRRCSTLAAKRFFRKLLKGFRMVPCAIVTGSASKLRGSESHRHADRLPYSRLAPEQPRRELAPTGPPT
jgi:putative transposase